MKVGVSYGDDNMKKKNKNGPFEYCYNLLLFNGIVSEIGSKTWLVKIKIINIISGQY